ncbi:KAP family P-loop NTPase fold protein [Pseudomonas aeruginosa]|nr:P-loop ATPase [Pseudomonas aeruginosa]
MERQMAWSGDLLGRKAIAELLTDYLDSSDYIKVVNINSPWGTGKSYFLKEWRLSLMGNRPVVFFNAWENDFTGDPLISLVANIRDQLSQYRNETTAFRKSLTDLLNTASDAAVATAPLLVKGFIKKTTGVALDELGEAVGGTLAESSAEAAGKFVKRLIEENKKNLDSVKSFKESLRNLFSEVINDSQRPVYIFIDELDRCRPPYAIELLERVKHLFEVEGCRFVIASDTVQLSHSIRAVYGEGFSSMDYLKRFFDLTYTFERPDLENWVRTHVVSSDVVGLDYCDPEHRDVYLDPQERVRPIRCVFIKEFSENQQIFLLLARAFNTDLRQLERVNKMLEAVLSRTRLKDVEFAFVAYLCFLLNKDEEMFNSLREYPDGTIEALREKYVANDNLYFYSFCLNVHEIASIYLQLALSEKDDRDALASRYKLEFVRRAARISMGKKKNIMLSYFEEVRLAGRIT